MIQIRHSITHTIKIIKKEEISIVFILNRKNFFRYLHGIMEFEKE